VTRAHHSALQDFARQRQAQLLLTGVHALAPRITGWLAATQARLGMPDEARATLTGFFHEPERMGAIHNACAVICLADGDPAAALDELREVRDITPMSALRSHSLKRICSLAPRTSTWGSKRRRRRSRAALGAAEPDRLIFRCNDRSRGTARTRSRVTKRLMAPFAPTSSTCCEARRRRAPTESAYRNRRSSAE